MDTFFVWPKTREMSVETQQPPTTKSERPNKLTRNTLHTNGDKAHKEQNIAFTAPQENISAAAAPAYYNMKSSLLFFVGIFLYPLYNRAMAMRLSLTLTMALRNRASFAALKNGPWSKPSWPMPLR
jgi:hypothetical protein